MRAYERNASMISVARRDIVQTWALLFFGWVVMGGGNIARAGVNVWTTNGPYGGRVSAVAIDPSTPTTLYAGTINGVFKSTNLGATWSAANNGLPNLIYNLIYALALDPSTPTTLYAGTAESGVYKSTDGGASWASSGLSNSTIRGLTIDPSTPTTLYAATGDALFKSTDSGASWAAANNGLNHVYVYGVAVDPSTPSTLYANGGNSTVYKSTDGGGSWAAANNGLPDSGIETVAIDPSTPTTLYAGTYDHGAYKSTDGGATWTYAGLGGVSTWAIDPSTPTTLYAGSNYDGVYKSTNGGMSWAPINSGLSDEDVVTLVVDPSTPTTLYAGTGCGGVFQSTSGGTSWSATNNGLTATWVEALAIDSTTPATVYAGTKGNGVFKSTDGGASWTATNAGIPTYRSCTYGTVDALSIDPSNPMTVYAGIGGGYDGGYGVFRSTDGAASWTFSGSGLIGPDSLVESVTALAIDASTPTILYAGTPSDGVYKSTNGGASWISSGLAGNEVRALAIDPSTPTTLYAARLQYSDSRGVHKSTDGGSSWTATGSSSPVIYALAIDPSAPMSLYAGYGAGVFKSTNGGATWVSHLIYSGSTPLPVKTLALDPSNSTTLYAGTSSYSGTSGGTFKSMDGGASWGMLGLPEASISALAVDPSMPTILYVGTEGRGVYVIQSLCGNSTLDLNEECDDGNSNDLDACKTDCTLNVCGDGAIYTGVEQCDDGNLVDGDGCDSNCTPTGCGNGIVTTGEQCDDGNTASGDCCDASCRLETLNSPCEDDGNLCTVDRCDGNGSCIHTPAPPGTACNDSNPCTSDYCDGSGACAHQPAPAGTVCRPAAGDCDLVEVCDGVSRFCPGDAKSTAVCRPVAGNCDLAENCDGVTDDCPQDSFVAAGTECRAANGLCAAAQCAGSSATCPVANGCDDANDCTTDSCDPMLGCTHTPVTDGQTCDDNDACSLNDQCVGGQCHGSPGAALGGTVFANTATPGNALAGAFVQVCDATFSCLVTTADSAGLYSVCGLTPGQYTVTAFPPGGTTLLPGTAGPISIIGTETLSNADVVVAVPMPLPSNTDITHRYVTSDGLPGVYWEEPLTLTTTGCAGATAAYEMTQGGPVFRSGPMTEGPGGTYTGTIAALYPVHGYAHTSITLQCPDSTVMAPEFDLYIDPSGTVQTVDGTPVAGATVRLLRADSPSGPFVAVPDGSGIMSIANRRNPDTTDAAGHFGWDVIAGYYKVRVEKSGCVSSKLAQAFVETAVLAIPPPAMDLDVRLACDCVPLEDAKIVIKKLNTAPGDDRLTFKGKTILAVPISPPLDPLAHGLRVVLGDTAESLIDLTLPGGAYAKPPGVGWRLKIGKNVKTWTYVDKRANPPSGIYQVVVHDHSPKVPGLVEFVAKGRRAYYPVASADLPVTGLVVLVPPAGGQCGLALFPGPAPAPLCTISRGVLSCK